MLKLGELGRSATKKDLAIRVVDKVQWNEATEALAVLRLYHQVAHGLRDGIDDDAADLATRTIGTGCFGPDRELNRIRHSHLPRLTLFLHRNQSQRWLFCVQFAWCCVRRPGPRYCVVAGLSDGPIRTTLLV
jgi:hypothetical protein